MPLRTALDAEQVAQIDTAGQAGDILALPDHVTDALWRVDSAAIQPVDDAAGLIVCGLGGSAIGASLAVDALGSRTSRPIIGVRGYELPSWASSDWTILCSSYSGNTEETLACFDQAVDLGARVIVATSGGVLADRAHDQGLAVVGLPGVLQPRAAVGYMTITVLQVAALSGVSPSIKSEIEGSVALLMQCCADWGPDSSEDSLSKRLAVSALDKLVAVYGAQATTAAAYRWKCQINENAKVPCWTGEIPEANHNDINGWGGAPSLGEHLVWLLRDADQHARNRKRIELTAAAAADAGVGVEVIDSVGGSRFERLMSTVLLGDLVSLYLAVLRGVDPSPVPVIEWLKDSLGRPVG